MAWTSAFASSIDLISKRKTKSPPYLARRVGGGRATAAALPLTFVKPVSGGRRQIVCMRLSRAYESHDLGGELCKAGWAIWRGSRGLGWGWFGEEAMVRGGRNSEAHKSQARLNARKVMQLIEEEEEEEEEEEVEEVEEEEEEKCIIMCMCWSGCWFLIGHYLFFISDFFLFSYSLTN